VKKCSKCGEEKPETEFNKNKRNQDGLDYWCRKCYSNYRQQPENKRHQAAASKERNQKPENKFRAMNRHRKRKYDLTNEQYNRMSEEQNGCCIICGKHQSELKQPLGVDHDHRTGKNRGLLCKKCNFGIGYFDENINSLENAIIYLGANK
jgi:hypothetical protein